MLDEIRQGGGLLIELLRFLLAVAAEVGYLRAFPGGGLEGWAQVQQSVLGNADEYSVILVIRCMEDVKSAACLTALQQRSL